MKGAFTLRVSFDDSSLGGPNYTEFPYLYLFPRNWSVTNGKKNNWTHKGFYFSFEARNRKTIVFNDTTNLIVSSRTTSTFPNVRIIPLENESWFGASATTCESAKWGLLRKHANRNISGHLQFTLLQSTSFCNCSKSVSTLHIPHITANKVIFRNRNEPVIGTALLYSYHIRNCASQQGNLNFYCKR